MQHDSGCSVEVFALYQCSFECSMARPNTSLVRSDIPVLKT